MIALDTSILARLILRDNPEEERAAMEFIAANRCTVGWSVLIELCWVLERSARLPRHEVVAGIATIAAIDTITVPDPVSLEWALARFEREADFPDMIHLVSASAGSTDFATFDRKLGRQAGDDPPLPIQTLRA